MSGVGFQVTGGGAEHKVVLVAGGLAQEPVEPFRSFEPPVPKKLGIKGADHDGIHVHVGPEFGDLLAACLEKVMRVMVRSSEGPGASVKVFVCCRACDPVVLEAGEAPWLISQEISEIFHGKVEAQIPVEIAIGGVSRVTLLGTPDLAAGVAVAPKRGGPAGGETRGVDGVARPRIAKHQAVSVDDVPAQVGLAQDGVETRDVGAFREPDSGRILAETLAVMVASDEHLRPHGLGGDLHQGQKTVGRCASDDFQETRVGEALKCEYEVLIPAVVPREASGFEAVGVKGAQGFQRRIAPGALFFAMG
ncbi:MAG: hypothetical protein RLZZ399_2411 [Verrucomicrobiota bacterium]